MQEQDKVVAMSNWMAGGAVAVNCASGGKVLIGAGKEEGDGDDRLCHLRASG